ncbi:MAG: hypothetical protein B6I38_05660 [Anaerolineaceae bacterium 4572_5.1]|nr:MAG: hypothetical protein B5M51_06675 [Anaerolinea sp. 4484_236]OQY31585.1 MAG: hypothetical protein B6I38_05660 [Anaerolineaceae bacterium 4572_5.1]
MTHNNHDRKRGLLWPFILISVGLAFLFQNLGLLGSDIWSALIQLWPLLLILLGLNDLIRTRSIVGPVFTIGLGIIFLGSNLNLLGWNSWISVLRLWPVLIIAIGLEIFIGRKSILLSSFGVLAALAIMTAGLWFSGAVDGVDGVTLGGAPLVSEVIEQSLDGAAEADVRIDASVGALYIEALSDSDNLIEGKIFTGENETITQDFKIEDGTAFYELNSDFSGSMPFLNNMDMEKNDFTWDLLLNDETPLILDITLGVGESRLDLSELTVTELDLEIGVGQTRINLPAGDYGGRVEGGVGQTIVTLPEEGQIQLRVNGGVGEIVIRVPEGMAVKAHVDRGISGLSVPSGYSQNNDTYTSPGYATAKNQIDLYLDQGIGNIAIRGD